MANTGTNPTETTTAKRSHSAHTEQYQHQGNTIIPITDDQSSSPAHTAADLVTPYPPSFEQRFSLQRLTYANPSPVTGNRIPHRLDDLLFPDVDSRFAIGHIGAARWDYERLIQVLLKDFEQLCINSERNGATGISSVHPNFFSKEKQPFSLLFYLRRLVLWADCSPSAFIIMRIYLDRIQENFPDLQLNELNCHRLICTSLVLAIKYVDDEVCRNPYYAWLGGVKRELNHLELHLIRILDWNLAVTSETYSLYEDKLIHSANSLP